MPHAAVRDEARLLVAGVLAAASRVAGGWPGEAGCRCPLCRAAAAVREPDPRLSERLADAVGAVAGTVADLLRTRPDGAPPASGTPDPVPPQHGAPDHDPVPPEHGAASERGAAPRHRAASEHVAASEDGPASERGAAAERGASGHGAAGDHRPVPPGHRAASEDGAVVDDGGSAEREPVPAGYGARPGHGAAAYAAGEPADGGVQTKGDVGCQ